MTARELIRETAWSREFRLGPESFSFESKFVRDGLDVAAETVRNDWARWGPAEQLSFVSAFILKPVLTTEDQKIITFLMDHGSEPVWAILAHIMPRHSDREQAVSFLLERVIARNRHAASYFHALASIGDPRAIPALQQRYRKYVADLAPFHQHDFWSEITEYLACCGTLWRLAESPEYEIAIRELFSHPDAAVRRAAQKEYVDKKLNYVPRSAEPTERPPEAARHPNELLKETAWSRVYSGQPGFCWYVSRFSTDGLQASADSIRERWPHLALEEQAEFAQSFCQKPAFSEQDLQILQLLTEQGLEIVQTVVAGQLQGHPGLESVLPMLLERVLSPEPQAVTYFELLRLIGDTRAVPPLRRRYEEYRAELIGLRQRKIDDLSGYLHCCQALRALTGSTEYETALEELLLHPDETVRREVRRLLPPKKS